MRNERSQILLFGFGRAHDELAGRVVVLGYRTLRAAEVEDALELIGRQLQPVRVLMFATNAPFKSRAQDLRTMSERAGALGLRAIVSGAQPEPAEIAALKRDGVKYCLWKGFNDAELGFVLNAALYDETRGQHRPATRVPANVVVRVKSGAGEKAGMISNLSATGAFIETQRAGMPGGRITLSIEFVDGAIAIPASVVFANVPGNLQRPNAPLGMGVKFAPGAPEAAARIAKFVRERSRAYEL
ncbi:MAG: PilZ domain-containing protein [Deltaproteobacteria bacterium]|nr:PilZ domain-containing protein [Deltaproteobacteria bacterium]